MGENVVMAFLKVFDDHGVQLTANTVKQEELRHVQVGDEAAGELLIHEALKSAVTDVESM